jgi:phosphate transport system substrate-binding protein
MILAAILLLLAILGGGLWLFKRSGSKQSASAGSGIDHGTGSVAVPRVIRLSGSNTIGARLGPDLAEAWLNSQGASNIHRAQSAREETLITATKSGTDVSVLVKAHGSATAFADLGAGACDIGMASRKIKAGEAADLQSKSLGDLTSNSNERVLGIDGLAIIVNESNPNDTMTKDEVADIFSGKASQQTWNIYARDDKSGTYDTFKDRVLGARPLTSSAKRFEDSRELVSAVAQDRNGIGFVGLPYAVGVKVLAIGEKGAIPLVPNTMTVRTESYPLSRRLYLYLPDNAKNEARDFVRFALSPAGQDVVEKDGFMGQKIDIIKVAAPPNAPAGYLALSPTADRLSVDFRFRTGSSQLDTKAVDDIKRMAAAMQQQYAGRGMMLIGFADSTGNSASNLQLSKDRAEAVSNQMKQQGINPVFVTGFGQQLPVADNSTPEGREKNRRVEVWLRK